MRCSARQKNKRRRLYLPRLRGCGHTVRRKAVLRPAAGHVEECSFTGRGGLRKAVLRPRRKVTQRSAVLQAAGHGGNRNRNEGISTKEPEGRNRNEGTRTKEPERRNRNEGTGTKKTERRKKLSFIRSMQVFLLGLPPPSMQVCLLGRAVHEGCAAQWCLLT